MIFLLGGQGFVGSAFQRLFKSLDLEHVVLTRSNYDAHIGKSCDVFLNANGNSKKFMADRDPAWEFDASVRSVSNSLTDFKANRYIHLSTGDVYPSQVSPESTREDQYPDPCAMSRYGLHKYVAETLVRGAHDNHLIFRMGGFVGPNLKKNAIFDMLNNDPVWLDPESELQFIHTDSAARIVWALATKPLKNEVFNLGALGAVKLHDVWSRINSQSEFKPDAPKVRFEQSLDKLQSVLGAALPQSDTEVSAYLTSLGR